MENKLAKNCIDRQIAALTALHEVLETQAYRTIVSLVTAAARENYARRVLIAGVGKNSSIASKISDTMVSLGIPSLAINVSHLGHGDYGRIGPEDLIIHISRSGSTREMLEAIDHIDLIRPNVVQVLIHCKKDKPMNNKVAIELFIGSVAEGDEFELAPTTSTTALLCALDTIAVQASHNIGFKRLDFLKYHPDGKLGEMLKAEVSLRSEAELNHDYLVQKMQPMYDALKVQAPKRNE